MQTKSKRYKPKSKGKGRGVDRNICTTECMPPDILGSIFGKPCLLLPALSSLFFFFFLERCPKTHTYADFLCGVKTRKEGGLKIKKKKNRNKQKINKRLSNQSSSELTNSLTTIQPATTEPTTQITNPSNT